MTDEFERLIHAELDGEITPDERARLASLIDADPGLAEEARAYRQLGTILRAVPPVAAPAGFADSVMGAAVMADSADGGVAEGDVAGRSNAAPRFRLVRAAPWMALAAGLLIAVAFATRPDERFQSPGTTETAAVDRSARGDSADVKDRAKAVDAGLADALEEGFEAGSELRFRRRVAEQDKERPSEATADAAPQRAATPAPRMPAPRMPAPRKKVGAKDAPAPPATAAAPPESNSAPPRPTPRPTPARKPVTAKSPGAPERTSPPGTAPADTSPAAGEPSTPLAEGDDTASTPDFEKVLDDDRDATRKRGASRDAKRRMPIRYVVFHDVAAAERFAASLSAAVARDAKGKSEVTAERRKPDPGGPDLDDTDPDDTDPDSPDRGSADPGGAGPGGAGPATGGGSERPAADPAASSGRGLAASSARIVARLTIPSARPSVRALLDVPLSDGQWAAAAPPEVRELLARAAEERKDVEDRRRRETADADTADEPEVESERGGVGGGGGVVGVGAGAAAGAGSLSSAAARVTTVEIVIVVVPPPKPTGSKPGR